MIFEKRLPAVLFYRLHVFRLDCTVITIAHRVTTIQDYNMVIEMDAGRVARVGTPAEILGHALHVHHH